MIKVIKSGKRVHTMECKCGCVFSFEREDIKEIHYNDYFICVFDNRKVVYCPECRQPNTVDMERLKNEEE